MARKKRIIPVLSAPFAFYKLSGNYQILALSAGCLHILFLSVTCQVV